jgi:hypothetical protein
MLRNIKERFIKDTWELDISMWCHAQHLSDEFSKVRNRNMLEYVTTYDIVEGIITKRELLITRNDQGFSLGFYARSTTLLESIIIVIKSIKKHITSIKWGPSWSNF